MAVGIWRPVVLLPASWLTGLPPDVLDAVVAHELAHIRRWDLWVNLLQRLLETAFFYNPAVWWVSRRVTQERETCCDELAATATRGRETYVLALEVLARTSAGFQPPVLGTALRGERKMHLARRVKYLLTDPGVVRESRWWPVGLLFAALPPAAWILSLCLATAGGPSARAAEHTSKPVTPREKELMRLVQELREELRQLRREMNEIREGKEGPEHHGGKEHEGRERHEGEKREGREHHEREGDERRMHHERDDDGGEHHEREEREGRKHHENEEGEARERRDPGHREREKRESREHREREGREGREHGEGEGHESRERREREGREREGHGHGREGGEGGERAARAAKLFKVYDANGDKKVSKGELFRKLGVNEHDVANRAKAERAFRAGDKDGDGTWSLAEFSAKVRREHH